MNSHVAGRFDPIMLIIPIQAEGHSVEERLCMCGSAFDCLERHAIVVAPEDSNNLPSLSTKFYRISLLNDLNGNSYMFKV